MTKNILKRTLAGMLAVLTVAATVPADVSWSELLGGTAIVASAETAAAEFVKTTVDTIGSDLKNNFGAVSEETVDAWKAENDAALKAERAAAGNDAYLYIVYATDENLYKVKKLYDNGVWASDTYSLVTLKEEMQDYNSVVYYTKQPTIPFEEHPFTKDQFFYQFPSSIDVLKVNKIEALVKIDKAPDWGLIQISDFSEIKQCTFKDLNNGVHKYVWDKNNPDYTLEGGGAYGQIQLGSSRDGQYGSLVGYKFYMEGQNDPIKVGDWTYPVSVVPTGLEAHCGDTLEDVELPNRSDNDQGTWSWKEPDTDVGDVGINTFTAVFTPNDDSLKTVEFDVDVAVSKIDFTLEGAEDLVYDGAPHTLVKGDIPEGTKFSLTEPQILDFYEEGEKLEPMLNATYEKLNTLSLGSTEYNYFYNLLNSLNYYYSAISELKEGSTANLSYNIYWATYHADTLAGIEYTPDAEFSEAEEYVYTYIKDKTGSDLLDRFTDKTDWKDAAEATDAGDYTVWYKGTGNYSDTIKTFDVTIAKADFTIEGAEGLVYDGKPHTLVKGDIPEGTKFSLTEPQVLDPDEEKEKLAPMVQAALTKYSEAEYGSTEHKYFNYLYGSLAYYYDAVNSFKENDISSLNYYISNATYYAVKMAEIEYTPDAEFNEAVEYVNTCIKGKTVDDLIDRFADKTDWKDTAEATEAGKYTVWYKGTGNYSDTVKTVDVTIAKADFTIEGAEGLVYDGKPHTLVKGDIPEGTKFSLTEPQVLDPDEEKEKLIPMAQAVLSKITSSNSGTNEYNYCVALYNALNFYYRAIGDVKENYATGLNSDVEKAAKYAADMAAIDYTPDAEISEAAEYVNTYIKGKTADDVIDRFADKTEWLDTAEATDAGDYTVWYKGTGNYSDTVKTVDVTIAKADLKVTAPKANELTYNRSAQQLVTPGSVENGTMQYAVTDTSVSSAPADGWSKDVPKETKAGTYRVWYKGAAEDSDNYNDSKPAYVDVTITKEDIKVTAPTANKLTYNGSAQKLVKAGKASAGTMQYALGTSDKEAPASGYSDKLPTATNAGTYYVWYKVVGDAAHDDTQPACVTVKINRLSIMDAKVMVRNKTYTGKALKPGSKVVVNGKRLKKGVDYTVTYKNNKNVGVGKAVINGIGNYTGKVTTEFNIRPKKAAIKSVSSPKAKQLKVTWKKTPQATGYNIKVSTSKDFKTKNLVRNAFVKNNSTFSKTFAPLKSGKTYYVKIRAYKKTKSGKIYGQYSSVKTIKVK